MTIQKKVFETIGEKTGYWYSYINVPNDYQIKENEKKTSPLTNLESEKWSKRSYSNFLFLIRDDINEDQ